MIASPTGTLIRNSARQPTTSTSTPPSAGPAAAAIAPAALQAPIAAARRSGAVSASTTASEAGIIAAAAAPWSPRVASNAGSEGASAQARLSAVNPPTPARRSVLRPTTSATRPAGARHAANVTAYTVMIQVAPLTEAPAKSVRTSATARFATVVSSSARKAAPAATASTFGARLGTAIAVIIGPSFDKKARSDPSLYHRTNDRATFFPRWTQSTWRRSRAPNWRRPRRPTAGVGAAMPRASRSCRRRRTWPRSKASRA